MTTEPNRPGHDGPPNEYVSEGYGRAKEPKRVKKTEPAARGVNEWLTREMLNRLAFATGPMRAFTDAVESARAALPPLVLASEAERMRVEWSKWRVQIDEADALVENSRESLAQSHRELASMTTTAVQYKREADTLRARVAELEARRDDLIRSRDVWEADALRQAQNAAHWRAKFEASLRPHPSAPNAGEALEEPQMVKEWRQAADALTPDAWPKTRATLAYIDALIARAASAPAPVAADAGLTDEVIDALLTTWFGPASRSDIEDRDNRADMAKTIAKYLELRPQPARLTLPTDEELNDLLVKLAHEGVALASLDLWDKHTPTMLGIVREQIRRWGAEERQPARLRMPTEGESDALYLAMRDAVQPTDGGFVPMGANRRVHDRLVAFLRTLGAEIVEGGTRVEAGKLSRGDDGTPCRIATFAAPAPAREPEPVDWAEYESTLVRDIVLAHAAGGHPLNVSDAQGAAYLLTQAARRRVEGEEAGK